MARTPRPTHVTTAKAAEILGVSTYLVRQWIRLGVLKATKPETIYQQTHWNVSVSSIRRLKKQRGQQRAGQAAKATA
jgi:predicted site-specific integrase-resolvase